MLFNPGTGESDVYDLPAANWQIDGSLDNFRGYRYADKDLVAGPCKSVRLRVGRQLKIQCKGAGIAFTLDEPSQGSLGVALRTDVIDLCTVFGGVVKKDLPVNGSSTGVFAAKKAPEPAQCGAP